MDKNCSPRKTEDKATKDVVEPPGFDELPPWFQAEIEEQNDRRGGELDTRKSRSQRHKKGVIYAGAIINVILSGSASPLGYSSLVFMALMGALVGFLIFKWEPSPPGGILISAVCNLPPFFVFSKVQGLSGMDAVPFFVTILFFAVSGLLLSMVVASERREYLPF